MNLWLSAHFLFAAFLSSSALTPEECRPLVTPLSLSDVSMMLGRWNFLVAYTDHEVHSTILKGIGSSWVNVTGLSDNHKGEIHCYDNINGTCFESTASLSVDSFQGSMAYENISSTFHILPSSDGLLTYSINTTIRNLDSLLQLLNLHVDIPEDKSTFHSVFLTSSETTLKDSDLEHFRQQASCFGFSGEPHFLHDPKNEFCAEGKGIKLSL